MIETLFENLPNYLTHVSPVAYLIAFVGGVWASFTPCIYPIIPILVGTIGATGAKSRLRAFELSFSFVFGMALTYSLLGLFAALTGQIFGRLTTHPLAFLGVGNLCLVFALSMLGLFEIRLPGSWGRASLERKEKGLGGVFLMGMSSGVVAAPCTVPVLGALLAFVAQARSVAFGLSLLFTFAMGLGFLLLVIGTFTGLVTALPKSGPWVARMKQLFGVLLLLAAEFFIFQAGKSF